MTIFRRTLLIWLWMFWQGGFLFYGSVVVTIGSSVLESDFSQGMITRHVTHAINITGGVVLLAWLWDLLAERQSHRCLRWTTWLLLLSSIGILMVLRENMMTHILDDERLIDRVNFRRLHRWYLRVYTMQLVLAILFTVWTMRNWRTGDAAASGRDRLS